MGDIEIVKFTEHLLSEAQIRRSAGPMNYSRDSVQRLKELKRNMNGKWDGVRIEAPKSETVPGGRKNDST
jgi:hypothetical protein